MPRAFLFSSNRYLSGRRLCKVVEEPRSDSVTFPLPDPSPLDLSCTKHQVDLKITSDYASNNVCGPMDGGADMGRSDTTNLSILCQVALCSTDELPEPRSAPSSTSAALGCTILFQGTEKRETGRPKRKRLPKINTIENVDEESDGASQLDQETKSSDYENKDDSERFICQDCGKKYTTASNLTRHRQTHRSISDKTARKCPYCERIYVSSPAYNMHVQTHVQGCECPHCQKRFSRQWLLQGHLRTHTGEKPFQCNKCEKRFADKSNLRAHIQTHSDEKPYLCSHCGKSFALRSYLTKHEEASCGKAAQD